VSDDASAAAALRLPQVLDLNAAAPLAAELMSHRGRPIEIDASAVDRLGAQCVQVLLAARKTWDSDGLSFSTVAASAEFASVLGLLAAPTQPFLPAAELA
jgi:chemotaxis protein CheX